MRCCEAWKPIKDCFDTSSFECVDFQRLSQIIANLTRETLAEREAEITNRCRSGQRAWRNKKPVLSLSAVTDEEGHPLENEDESGRRLLSIGEPFSRHARKARGITSMKTFCGMSNRLLMTSVGPLIRLSLFAVKKNSAPGPDGIPYGAYRCAGGLGSQILFNAYRAVLEGSAIPDCFAESRTIFIPKSSDIDDFGRIIRSLDALRPLTLCTCDCKLLTSAICRGLHWCTMRCIHTSQRCISSRQNDG